MHRKKNRLKLIVGLVLGLAIVLSTIYLLGRNTKNSQTLPLPISKSSAQLLNYDIYYPDQKLLPSGYTLDKNSFNSTDQAFVYSVSYGNNQKIIFSDQTKPTTSQIQSFYAKAIPLHNTLKTNVGAAAIGIIKFQTVVSLPTNTNAWIIATAPLNINQTQLNQVIKSIKPAK